MNTVVPFTTQAKQRQEREWEEEKSSRRVVVGVVVGNMSFAPVAVCKTWT